MLNELDDLDRCGLFSWSEIAEIVKQRRKFEYRSKRRSPLKEDFLVYIDYEKKLDELRTLRKKSLFKSHGNKKKWKKSVSDFAGISRIVDIYRLLTTKFKGDIVLWFQYLEFCKQRRNGRMKKALAQAIRFHPKVPELWIYAAAWEFDHNLNSAAARALMQSGLRACPTSEDLWVECLRMELTYLNKLKTRKVALGEDEGTLALTAKDVDEKKWNEENAHLFMPLDEKTEDKTSLVTVDGESMEKDKPDIIREQGFNVLQTVYSGATKALPSSFILRIRLLEIFEATDMANSDLIRDEILSGLKCDFSKDSEYWDWLAKYENRNRLSRAIEVYDEAIKFVPSITLFDFCLKFLMDAINKDGDVENLTLHII